MSAHAGDLVREDFRVTTSDGLGIQVREIRPASLLGTEPVILVHGARVAGLASFDLDVAGGSLAADLANRLGVAVFIMDARGYGASDRQEALERPPQQIAPQSRAFEVVRDIDAVAEAAIGRTGANAVALFGWATGGMWASYYASLRPERVGHLVTLNALYGGSSRHPALGYGSAYADPLHPDRLNAGIGGYALNDAASLWPSWDRTIPIDDKSAWRDPAVAEAYARAALASDPEASRHQPPAFRAPMGAIEDSFYQANGRRLFDSANITAPTLVVRSELDFWSRPEDADAFAHDAVHARQLRVITLPGATHYVHLDRPARGRDALLRELVGFLGGDRRPDEGH
jgi:pimeloyl-ACP methyl ester carboxylesterase